MQNLGTSGNLFVPIILPWGPEVSIVWAGIYKIAASFLGPQQGESFVSQLAKLPGA